MGLSWMSTLRERKIFSGQRVLTKKSGSKSVFRCPDCLDTTVLPVGQRPSFCKCGFEKAEILKPILSKGQMKAMLPEPKEIRDYVIDQLQKVEV